jgi:hypothetical protein
LSSEYDPWVCDWLMITICQDVMFLARYAVYVVALYGVRPNRGTVAASETPAHAASLAPCHKLPAPLEGAARQAIAITP